VDTVTSVDSSSGVASAPVPIPSGRQRWPTTEGLVSCNISNVPAA
jgi:hypothetical protein